ncbi:restriction endonuclease [Phototrophicus methaneseepsis]|uniref:Restriction endonuclease n=1 Tax=Phototrophicus methaneseepsis TaxID=2710758 RepID=A0A7S8IFG1_9CHLR|nr:restriction endonuclease [Phototrophicus methaneseepsis]QPC82918.1 restriction endonuclease [Phototrophicus methaneseepsis]
METYGYTIDFFANIFEFFYDDLYQAMYEELQSRLNKTTYSPEDVKHKLHAYLTNQGKQASKKCLEDFIHFIQKLFTSDFKSPPFHLDYNYKALDPDFYKRYGLEPRPTKSAKEYFSSIRRYGVIDVSEVREYMLAHFEQFPYSIMMVLILFEPHTFYAYSEFEEILTFFWARLALEIADPIEEFKLDISECVNTDYLYGELLPPQQYLESIHFDFAQNLIQKVSLYNRVFKALFENEEDLRTQYIKSRCKELLLSCDTAKSNNEKGKALEDLTELLFTLNNVLTLVDKRVSTGDEEIDLVIQNNIDRPFWLAFQSPLFFIECKNWSRPVGTAEIRNFEGKLRNHQRMVRIGFFVCLSGFTNEVFSELKRMGRDGQHIVLIKRDDIEEFISSDMDFFVWLERRTAIFY